MIEYLHNTAIKIRWLKPFAVGFGVAALGASLWFLWSATSNSDLYLIPALLSFTWCLLLYSFIELFSVPPAVSTQTSTFFERVVLKIKYFFYVDLAIIFLLLTILVIYMSYELIYVWSHE